MNFDPADYDSGRRLGKVYKKYMKKHGNKPAPDIPESVFAAAKAKMPGSSGAKKPHKSSKKKKKKKKPKRIAPTQVPMVNIPPVPKPPPLPTVFGSSASQGAKMVAEAIKRLNQSEKAAGKKSDGRKKAHSAHNKKERAKLVAKLRRIECKEALKGKKTKTSKLSNGEIQSLITSRS